MRTHCCADRSELIIMTSLVSQSYEGKASGAPNKSIFSKLCAKKRAVAVPPDFVNIDNLLDITLPGHGTYRNARVKSEKIVTRFGESLNLVMFLVNISVKN